MQECIDQCVTSHKEVKSMYMHLCRVYLGSSSFDIHGPLSVFVYRVTKKSNAVINGLRFVQN